MTTFGFTNDPDAYNLVCKWRNNAIADGWSHEPTYEYEVEDRVSTLKKEGFVAMIFTRTRVGKWDYEAMISLWGPDGLAIEPSITYNFGEIKRGLRVCVHCGREDVDTSRVGFAGRCCADCLPALRMKYERPGWTN